MKKIKVISLMLILLLCFLVPYVYSVIQGNYAVSVVDPSNPIRYYTVPGDSTNGMYVNVRSSNSITVTQSSASNLNATVQSNMTATGSGLVTIDTEHARIHAGTHYLYSDNQTISGTTTTYYLITTPNTALRAHIRYSFACDQKTLVTIYSGPSITANGVAVIKYNSDRSSGNTSGISIYTSPSIGNPGTPLRYDLIGSSGTIGGDTTMNNEFILNQNTSYLISITNRVAGSMEYSLTLIWYEV
jgi:hypothetical protein